MTERGSRSIRHPACAQSPDATFRDILADRGVAHPACLMRPINERGRDPPTGTVWRGAPAAPGRAAYATPSDVRQFGHDIHA
jgi:hypothetical protein